MLGKLLKYEIKATARTFLPLYAALMLLAILNRLFFAINSDSTFITIIGGILMAGYVLLIVGIFVITLIVILQRFYKNLVKEEGYLMFTLPVKPWELITSKLIASVIWTFVSTIVVMISVCIMTLSKGCFASFAQFMQLVNEYIPQYFGSVGLFWFEMFLMILISTIAGIMMFYGAISIGSLFKNKLLGSFVGYIILYLATQLISTVTIAIMGMSNMQYFENDVMPTQFPQTIFWIVFGLCVLMSAGSFFLSNYIFSKKLNLE
ncbi:MAG: ABC transporter permease [Anaerofustis sp.]